MGRVRHAIWAAPVALAAGVALGAAANPDASPKPPDPGRHVSAPASPGRAGPPPRPAPSPAVPAELERIAACESGGDPTRIGGGGLYRGKYQFTRETWRAMGGSGDPAAATEAEQDRRALALYRRSGTASWPGCSG